MSTRQLYYVRRMFHVGLDGGPFESVRAAAEYIKAELDKDSYWDYDGVAIMKSTDIWDCVNREDWAPLVYPEENRK